jgi:hypothetical protein
MTYDFFNNIFVLIIMYVFEYIFVLIGDYGVSRANDSTIKTAGAGTECVDILLFMRVFNFYFYFYFLFFRGYRAPEVLYGEILFFIFFFFFFVFYFYFLFFIFLLLTFFCFVCY